MLLSKSPKFSGNHYEILLNCGIHEYHNFTNFCNDCIKNVDFSLKAYFWASLKFGVTYCRKLGKRYKLFIVVTLLNTKTKFWKIRKIVLFVSQCCHNMIQHYVFLANCGQSNLFRTELTIFVKIINTNHIE